MKTKKQMVWLLCGLVALTTGCRQNELDIPGGKVLKAVIEGGETRTSFDSYEGKFAWTADDKLAVFYSDGTKSEATVATDGTVNVPASTASRYRSYYAVYPASVVENITDGSQPLAVTLPDTYDISDIVANASGNPGADFSPLPMVALNDEDNDILMFYHVGGLLRITLKGVRADTHTVYVMFDKGVTGSFPVSNPGTDHPTITAAEPSGENYLVKYIVGNPETGEGVGDTSKSIVLNVPVPCGTYNAVAVYTLGNSDYNYKTYEGTPLKFERHHGKKLSFGDLITKFYFVALGSFGGGSLINAQVPYDGGEGSLAERLYSFKSDGVTSEPVPFSLEYSEDGGTTWSTTVPDWMTPGTIDMSGSTTGQPFTYTAAHQVDTWESPHPGHLRANGTHTQAFDLSKYNVATGSTTEKSRTANCYVVDRPGLYKFPLVYGNGIDWEKNPTTGINEDAYRSRKGVNGEYYPDADTGHPANSNYYGRDSIYCNYYVGRFKDHLDKYITSPYIATQQSGKNLSATLVWEDVQGLVTDVQLTGSGEDTYLTFRVPSETIDQGNALVAVLADGKIAWSWHIWVTEEDLTDVKVAPSGYLLAPVNLGWCDGTDEYYAPRTCLVRATQEGSGQTLTGTFTQKEGTIKSLGNCPFYQWGRKDPMQASNGTEKQDLAKTYYLSSEAYAQNTVESKTTLGGAIQNPFVIYDASSYASDTHHWAKRSYLNLWSNNFDGNFQSLATVSKTIYDPCPVGFNVPSRAAFEGFTDNNCRWVSEDRGWTYDNSLFFPVTGLRNLKPMASYAIPGLFWTFNRLGYDFHYDRDNEYSSYYWTVNSRLTSQAYYLGLNHDGYSSSRVYSVSASTSMHSCDVVRPVKE